MNDSKSARQLGMSYATASNRLRKQFMFEILRRHHEDFCYRCKGEIKTAKELSIDHMIDWLDNDPSLFWKIENVTVSHLLCNTLAGRKVASNKKIVGPGNAWCTGCKQAHPIEAFDAHKSNWRGLQGQCREYRKARRPPRRKKKV